MTFLNVLKLMRVHQWIKNFFVFLPLFFAGKFLDKNILLLGIIAFLIFSLVASIIYIINDYVDIEKDKLHPIKKSRPLSSGLISKLQARILLIPLILLVIALSYSLPSKFPLIVILLYLIINLLYTFKLKNIAILDITIIAIGFVLRVVFGGLVTNIYVSKWAFLLTFALALILAIGKRRGELITNEGASRKSLEAYNIEFLNSCLIISISITLVCYIMYTISPDVVASFGSDYVYITTVFVILALFRYLQLTFVYNKTESPTSVVYKDFFLKFMILIWLISFAIIIYFR